MGAANITEIRRDAIALYERTERDTQQTLMAWVLRLTSIIQSLPSEYREPLAQHCGRELAQLIRNMVGAYRNTFSALMNVIADLAEATANESETSARLSRTLEELTKDRGSKMRPPICIAFSANREILPVDEVVLKEAEQDVEIVEALAKHVTCLINAYTESFPARPRPSFFSRTVRKIASAVGLTVHRASFVENYLSKDLANAMLEAIRATAQRSLANNGTFCFSGFGAVVSAQESMFFFPDIDLQAAVADLPQGDSNLRRSLLQGPPIAAFPAEEHATKEGSVGL